ncbi:unnamed protein product [Closterium sp. Naga37s-1]|nr:unnamed protein product [Closterium sp. Naga37s-1]
MNQPRRKSAFRIEPFRHKVEMDPRYAEKTWGILEDAIHQIYNHNASGLSFEELYRYAFYPSRGASSLPPLLPSSTCGIPNSRISRPHPPHLQPQRLGAQLRRALPDAIPRIYNHNASGLSFEELYRNAYNMVLHKYGGRLYAGLVVAQRAQHGAALHKYGDRLYAGLVWLLHSRLSFPPSLCLPIYVSPANQQRAQHGAALHNNAYNMVLHKYGDRLYAGLVSTMTAHLKGVAAAIEAAHGPLFLNELDARWHDYGKSLQMIRDILMYMDRTYVTNHNKTPVHDLGLALWRDHIVRAPAIRPRLLSTLLSLIHQERSGEVINRALMRSISSMFADLGPAVYSEDLERPFLEASAAFYRGEAQRYLGTCDCADYLRVAERRLEEEGERVAQYLDARTEGKVTGVVEREMVGNHLRLLVDMENSGLVPMLVNAKYEDIARMYRLLKRVPSGLQTMREVMSGHLRETGRQLVTDPDSVETMREVMSGHLRETGRQLVTDPDRYDDGARTEFVQRLLEEKDKCKDPVEFVQRLLEEKDKCKDPVKFVQHLLEEKDKCKDPVEFVQRLLEEKDKYDRIISASFASDKAFHTALSTAFEFFLNLNARAAAYPPLPRLLEEKDKYDRIISASFASDKAFHTALSTAFEFFLNLNARAAEYISLFIDDKLRKGLKGASEEEAEAVLDKVMTLFRFLQEKDVFEKYYKQHLAKRLLSGKTVSDDAERSFIVKLKTECGYQFTSKLEGMFLDMKTSQDTMHAFHCALQAEAAAAAVATGGGVGVVEERGGGEGEVEDPANGVAAAAALAATAAGLREEGGDEGGEEEGEGSARGGAAVAALRTEPDLALAGPSGTAAGSGAGSSSSASAAAGGAAAGGLFQGPTLSVQVLTTGSWPTQAGARCNLPGEILPICEKFTRHYLTTHTGRRLTWQMNMGHADVKAMFESRKYELSVSTYQMCILMLFNTHDSLTYRDIEAATDIPSADLRRNLQSLSLVRGKNVLRKEPVGKEVGDDDTFHFNHKFTSKFFKVKIGTISAQKETEPEKAETRQKVEEDRKPQIEAAIVRIMKSRRMLDHNNLVSEVTKQLQARFLPNPAVIKKRIESLIEREFLERDRNDRKLYRYLA